MATINQGILGGLSGKVGQVIGASWRGINYVRIYAVPANPKTTAQTTQRDKFKEAVQIAKTVLSSIINKFWENMYPKMSGFNAFVRANIAGMTGTGEWTPNIKFSLGSLEAANITNPTYNAGTGVFTVTIDPTIKSDGLATDKVVLIVTDKVRNMCYVNDSNLLRNSGTGTVQCAAGLTLANLHAHAFLYRGTAPNYVTSITTISVNPIAG